MTDKDLVIDPEEYKAVWLQFLGEDRQAGWCVSRQIWCSGGTRYLPTSEEHAMLGGFYE